MGAKGKDANPKIDWEHTGIVVADFPGSGVIGQIIDVNPGIPPTIPLDRVIANVPTGHTEFQFKADDLNFQSEEYDWLVVAGPQAKFKGRGRVNGASGYGFLLSARDGDANGGGGFGKFRIMIYIEATDEIVYDNELGMADDEDPTTIIESGAIVVHKKGKK